MLCASVYIAPAEELMGNGFGCNLDFEPKPLARIRGSKSGKDAYKKGPFVNPEVGKIFAESDRVGVKAVVDVCRKTMMDTYAKQGVEVWARPKLCAEAKAICDLIGVPV